MKTQDDLAELHRLAALALAGDRVALDTAVELAECLVLEQELAAAPSGIREEALAGVAAKWKARRQQDPVKTTAKKARALHAGATRNERLYEAIDAAVKHHRLQLVAWTGTDTSRAKWLAKQLNAKNGKFDADGSPSISGWRTVYNHLNTLQL
jgi:hypothetical protein